MHNPYANNSKQWARQNIYAKKTTELPKKKMEKKWTKGQTLLLLCSMREFLGQAMMGSMNDSSAHCSRRYHWAYGWNVGNSDTGVESSFPREFSTGPSNVGNNEQKENGKKMESGPSMKRWNVGPFAGLENGNFPREFSWTNTGSANSVRKSL